MVTTSDIQNEIKEAIAANKVVIYSKTECPQSMETKSLLKKKGVGAKIIELDQVTNGNEMQAKLQEMFNQTSTPNVFINGRHIGTHIDVRMLEKAGELDKHLESRMMGNVAETNEEEHSA